MRQDSGDAPEITFRKAGARLLELAPDLAELDWEGDPDDEVDRVDDAP